MKRHAKLIATGEAKAMRRLAHARLRVIIRSIWGSGAAVLLLSGAAMASVAASGLAMAGDVELGRYLSSECTTCHGAAKSDSTIPPIHGLDQRHFVEVLKAYRAKTLPNPAMQNIAGRLQDDDIAALAAYFAAARPR
jgi:cytochrome c